MLGREVSVNTDYAYCLFRDIDKLKHEYAKQLELKAKDFRVLDEVRAQVPVAEQRCLVVNHQLVETQALLKNKLIEFEDVKAVGIKIDLELKTVN